MSGHTVVVGYGTKGRAALATLRETGTPLGSIVVVDHSTRAMSEANRAGLVGVTGDATRRDVLASAQIEEAARVVVAVGRDDTAVLITLTARQLGLSTLDPGIGQVIGELLDCRHGLDLTERTCTSAEIGWCWSRRRRPAVSGRSTPRWGRSRRRRRPRRPERLC